MLDALDNELATQLKADLERRNGESETIQEEKKEQPHHKVGDKSRRIETFKHELPIVQSTMEETGIITHNQVSSGNNEELDDVDSELASQLNADLEKRMVKKELAKKSKRI